MKNIRNCLIAAALFGSMSLPASALTTSEVLTAMTSRVSEISAQMSDLNAQIAGAGSAAERAALMRELRVLNVRRGQLISLSRIVPRYNERYLTRIVTYFDLDVSPA